MFSTMWQRRWAGFLERMDGVAQDAVGVAA